MSHTATMHPPFVFPEPKRPIPWLSVLLSGAAAALFLSPEVSAHLGYDRDAVAAGEGWRLLTGHFVHWSEEHLGWSLLVFALLAFFWERTGRRRDLTLCVGGSALLISAAVWLVQPEMVLYRGLSGIDCALVTAVAVGSLRRTWRDRRRGLSLALVAALAGYFLKVFYEYMTGGMVFVDEASASFVSVPLAHLVGGAFGVVVGGRIEPPAAPLDSPT